MRAIAVMEGMNETGFNNYLSYVLDLLQINYRLLPIEDDENNQIDYAVLNSSKRLNTKSLAAEYCFANMDSSLKENINIYGSIITYGFGIKNTVTLSSIEENNGGFVYCLQRYLGLKNEKILEPQEIPVALKYNDDTELYAAMVAITIGLLEGLDCIDIEKKLSKKLLILT